MKCATERRQLILAFISDNRCVKIQQIMDEFGISRSTALRDVQLLQCSYPIYTETSGAGGVKAMEGWYLTHRYLRDDQEALLRSLLPGLALEEQKTMQQILTAFAKPKKEDKQ